MKFLVSVTACNFEIVGLVNREYGHIFSLQKFTNFADKQRLLGEYSSPPEFLHVCTTEDNSLLQLGCLPA
jgi:hypothetical protein